MLRNSSFTVFAAVLLVGSAAGADIYKYTDAKGNVLYTDKPATLPAQRLNLESKKTDPAAVQAQQEADAKRREEAEKARLAATGQQADQQAGAALSAKDKAEHCAKARARYDSYMSSQRLYETGADGQRHYLSDQELTAARAAAKVSMEELCK